MTRDEPHRIRTPWRHRPAAEVVREACFWSGQDLPIARYVDLVRLGLRSTQQHRAARRAPSGKHGRRSTSRERRVAWQRWRQRIRREARAWRGARFRWRP